ncbi:MAG: KUP/HAK/KT family potassium transporter [Vicinamibacterales bacterium]
MTMVITAVLLHVIATERWKWHPALATAITTVFLAIDLSFFGANALKIAHGGWLPLVIGGVLFTLMTTWKTGRALMSQRLTARAVPMAEFVARIAQQAPTRVPGTAVFMTAQPNATPAALVHNVRFNKVLHEHVITLMVITELVPSVDDEERTWVRAIGHGIYEVVVRYGFMEDPDVPHALTLARRHGLVLDPDDITYFLGRETLIVTKASGMAVWRERIFVFMARNAVRAAGFFRLPTERVAELGVQVEL